MDTRPLTEDELRDPHVDAFTVRPDMGQIEDDRPDGAPVIAIVVGWFGTLIVLGVYVLLRLAGVL